MKKLAYIGLLIAVLIAVCLVAFYRPLSEGQNTGSNQKTGVIEQAKR